MTKYLIILVFFLFIFYLLSNRMYKNNEGNNGNREQNKVSTVQTNHEPTKKITIDSVLIKKTRPVPKKLIFKDPLIEEAEQNYKNIIAPYNVNARKVYTGPFPGPFEQPIQELAFNADYPSHQPFKSSFKLQY